MASRKRARSVSPGELSDTTATNKPRGKKPRALDTEDEEEVRDYLEDTMPRRPRIQIAGQIPSFSQNIDHSSIPSLTLPHYPSTPIMSPQSVPVPNEEASNFFGEVPDLPTDLSDMPELGTFQEMDDSSLAQLLTFLTSEDDSLNAAPHSSDWPDLTGQSATAETPQMLSQPGPVAQDAPTITTLPADMFPPLPANMLSSSNTSMLPPQASEFSTSPPPNMLPSSPPNIFSSPPANLLISSPPSLFPSSPSSVLPPPAKILSSSPVDMPPPANFLPSSRADMFPRPANILPSSRADMFPPPANILLSSSPANMFPLLSPNRPSSPLLDMFSSSPATTFSAPDNNSMATLPDEMVVSMAGTVRAASPQFVGGMTLQTAQASLTESPVLVPGLSSLTGPPMAPSLWNTLVAHVLSGDSAGSGYHHHNPAQFCRRNRIEWPMNDHFLRHIMLFKRYVPYGNKCIPDSFGEVVLQAELNRCGHVHRNPQDLPVLEYPYVKLNDDVTMIKNLYYRGRRQSAIWDLFELLVSKGFMDYTCLRAPYDSLAAVNANTMPLWKLLDSFEGPMNDELRSMNNRQPQIPLKYMSNYDHDLQWLATMIVRCGRRLPELFDTMQASQILGAFRPDYYIKMRHFRVGDDHVNFNIPDQGQGNMHPSSPNYTGLQAFGFWLPHGIDMGDIILSIREHLDRFNRMEAAFRDAMWLSPVDLPICWEEVDYRFRKRRG